MNWDAIGAVAEIFGAIAVVATLFYLASQIKQSNIHARRNEHNATMEQVSLLRMTIAQNPALVDVALKGNESYGGLSENEKARYGALMGQQFWNYQQIWDRVQTGMYEPELWYETTGPIAASKLEAGALEWWELSKTQFPAAFIEEIETLMRRDA